MKNKFMSLSFLVFILVMFTLVRTSVGENVKKSIDDNADGGEGPAEEEAVALDIAVENETNITCNRRQGSQLHEIRKARQMFFPFMAAVMSHQNEYLCSGIVVSNGLILTTAKCTMLPVSYVLLNTTRAKRDDTSVLLRVIKSEKFPTFTGTENLKDVGLLYVEQHDNTIASKIRLSNFTDVRNVQYVEGIGFGLNAEIGEPRDLQYIGMELRSPLEGKEILKAFFDCVDTKIPTCFRDTGSAAIFYDELIGVVSKGQEDCTKEMSSTYAINKKMADIVPTFTFKAWLDERIEKNEGQNLDKDSNLSLSVYPNRPVYRRSNLNEEEGPIVLTNSVHTLQSSHSTILAFIFYTILAFACAF